MVGYVGILPAHKLRKRVYIYRVGEDENARVDERLSGGYGPQRGTGCAAYWVRRLRKQET